MKIRSPLISKVGGLTAATVVRLWMNTLDWKAAFYDPTVDPLHADCPGQMIYLFWHEYILAPLAMRGNANLAMLLSRHQDAEIIGRAALHLGFDTVRGSTSRGGASALRELLRKSQHMHLTIVPDGPRGPRRTMSLGPIYLSSKLGLPLVLLGVGFDQPWRAKSWDKFAVPRAYSRGRAVISPPLRLPPDLDRDGLERYRKQTEQLLNRLTVEAEAWAQSGTRKIQEQSVKPSAVNKNVVKRHRALQPDQGRADDHHVLLGPHTSITEPREGDGDMDFV